MLSATVVPSHPATAKIEPAPPFCTLALNVTLRLAKNVSDLGLL